MSDSREIATPQPDETPEEVASRARADAASVGVPDDGRASAEAVPTPVRYRWLKRILVASLALPALILGLHTWWGWKAERAIQDEIDKIVAAGEPIYPEDFDPVETLRDEENAALDLISGGAAFALSSSERDLLAELVVGKVGVKASLPQLRRIEQQNREALDLVRRARDKERADWGVRMRTPMINTLLPDLGTQRVLNRLVLAASLMRLDDGDSRAAWALLEDAIAHARTTDEHPTLIGHLIAIAEYHAAWITMETCLPRLEIATTTAPALDAAIPRSRVTDMVEHLRDANAFHAAHILAMQTERASLLDLIRGVAYQRISPWVVWANFGGTRPPSFTPLVILAARPALNEDAGFCLERLNRAVLSAKQPTWPRADALLPSEVPSWTGLDVWLHYLSREFEPSFRRATLLHYRAVAMRRMAAVALALRLFEVDHGERSASLLDLVPNYLPALPVDPFGDGEATFGFLRLAVRPRLYSVGANGIDEHGKVAFKPNGRVNWEVADQPFFLDGSRPRNSDELNTPAPQRSD